MGVVIIIIVIISRDSDRVEWWTYQCFYKYTRRGVRYKSEEGRDTKSSVYILVDTSGAADTAELHAGMLYSHFQCILRLIIIMTGPDVEKQMYKNVFDGLFMVIINYPVPCNDETGSGWKLIRTLSL